MNYISRTLLVTLSALSLLAGCDKKSNPTGSNTGNGEGWQVDQTYFRGDKILLNARISTDSSSFVVAGLSRISLYRTGAADSVTNAVAHNGRVLDSKPALSDQLIAYTGETPTQFVINSPYYWGGTVYNAGFPFVRSFRLGEEPDYSPLAEIPVSSVQTPLGAFNNRDQFLTAISDTAGDFSLCLVNLNSSTTRAGSTDLMEMDPEINHISFESGVSHWINYVGAFGENFFVSLTETSNRLIRVTPSGAVQGTSGVSGTVDDMFAQGDTLYAYSRDQAKVYFSADQGLNWTEYLSQFPVDNPRFFFMDGQMCGYIYSQLFKVDLDQQMLVELDNRGLEGTEITSVNKYNNRIWVTTLSGMFYKPAGEFFQPVDNSTRNKSNLGFRVENR